MKPVERLGGARRWALAAGMTLLAALPTASHAAPPDAARRISVVNFDFATGPGIITVDSARRLEHRALRLGLGLAYAAESLTAGRGDRPSYHVVEQQGVIDVAVAVGLWGVLELGLDLPIVVFASGGDGVGATSGLSGAAVGDLRITPKIGWGPHPDTGLQLAFLPIVTLPTGASDANAGERGVTFEPELAVSYRFGERAEVALTVGYRARPSLPFGHLLVDDEVTLGLGGRVNVWQGLSLLAECFAGIGLGDSDDDPDAGIDTSEVPVEAMAAVEYVTAGGFGAQLGGGAGLTSGWGAPAYRLFLTVSQVIGTKGPDDADDDGILDPSDGCPSEPEDRDGFEDDDGCPDPDDDGDGVLDAVDGCPRVAEDRDGFEDSDGCPDTDDDGDGIADTADGCPRVAEDVDGFQDGDGCPDLDNDADGIPDADDACPDEPETKNGVEDTDGCPDTSDATLTERGLELNDAIYFVVEQAAIMQKSAPLLDSVAALLIANPQVTRVAIEGHTDSRGVPALNLKLSKLRARAVLDALVARGVAPERLEAEGFGATRPVCESESRACMAKNRRTEFKVLELSGRPVAP